MRTYEEIQTILDEEFTNDCHTNTCTKCGDKYEYSTLKGYCQHCLDLSDNRQDEKNNSSCYSYTY